MATQPITEPEIDPETGKFIYSYQPRDSEGQFIGKPYKFLYTDNMDLVRQITEAKEHGDRYIYEVKTGKRQVKGEAAVPTPTYEPTPESTDEAERKRREQARKDMEAEIGAPVDQVRKDLQEARQLKEYLIGQRWALENESKGYHICPENGKAMGKYIKDNNLALTPSNLDLAFEELKDTLVPKPQEHLPADSTQQQATKPQSTGIIPGQLSGTRQPGRTEKQPLSKERFRQIDKMSRDQWNKLQRTSPDESKAYLAMKYPTQPQQ